MKYNVDTERQLFECVRNEITVQGNLLYAGAMLRHAADRFGDRLALIYQDERITFEQLYQRARAGARLLKQRGVVRGDRVLICFENSPDFYIAYFAVWQAGAVVVPVNTFLKEHELHYIVTDAQPKIICTSSDRISLFVGITIPIIIPSDMSTDTALLTEASSDDIIEQEHDAVCALLYTSGTTGVPKGVMLSSRAIVTNVLQVIARLQKVIRAGERIFAVLPLFHVFAQNTCVWAPMLTGCTVILVSKIDRRLIVRGLAHKPTFFLGVPALYGMLCLLKTAPLDSVEYFVSGGDALPDKIRGAFALLYRRKICNGYGLTETSPVIAVDLEVYAGPTGTVGKPLIDVICVARNEQGVDLPVGAIGELWTSGPHVMIGYYHEPELTKRVLVNGFFRTGDLGYIDATNTIVITGRLKDLIIHKGFNIYPQEIENVLLSHGNVIGAGVVGAIDDEGGEVPVAFVQLRSPDALIEQTLRVLCLQRLARYKVPRSFICSIESLPTTPTGKVDKKVLRQRLIAK
ncbi:MAG: AMP-binding protein [Candidatus Dependentiae bacterium]|nr:AMP-binding protein [Candidatus Dependentiae bacterium]